ncbi:MAG: 5-formyltetrahydrofolate cyclo-ligase [Phycisphaerales bacterium]|nr:5-formyltetrahydrofolate cyclo-ligase [Phycisphaerales bacterium]
MPDPTAAKQQQRKALRQHLAALSPDQRSTASAAIVDNVRARLDGQLAGGVLAFHPLPGEPDILPLLMELLEQGTTVCLPRVDWDQRLMTPAKLQGLGPEHLHIGRHSVAEPVPGEPIGLDELSVILVPGLGFDTAGRRLGRGGGFYDRLLATCPEHILPVGIGFQQQVLERIETGPSDIPLPMVITDSGFIELGSSTLPAD